MAVLEAIFLALICSCNAVTINEMFPFGTSYTGSATETTRNIQNLFSNATLLDSFDRVDIPSSQPDLVVFGADLGKTVFINYNGHFTFGSNYNSFIPIPLNTTNRNIIAVFFSDNDLRRENGLLHYRFTTDVNDLSTANTLFRREGFTTFSSRYCIIATWENVKYYIQQVSERTNPNFQQENTYQMVVCTDGSEGYIIFHYNKLEWSASQDTTTDQARAEWFLFSAPNSQMYKYYALPNTGSLQILNILSSSNIREPQTTGRWIISLPITGVCATKLDGVYAANCSSYYFCCNNNVEKTVNCPSGTVYHPFSGYCVESQVYPCGNNVVNFCDGKIDGRYVNTATPAFNDFYQCTKQLTRLHTCPDGISFNVGNPRCST